MLTHRWVKGALVNERQLSTCPDCRALRVEVMGPPRSPEEREKAKARSQSSAERLLIRTEYQRPVYDSGRISAGEPPCLRPPRRPAPW
jgi:hypothetical protein